MYFSNIEMVQIVLIVAATLELIALPYVVTLYVRSKKGR